MIGCAHELCIHSRGLEQDVIFDIAYMLDGIWRKICKTSPAW